MRGSLLQLDRLLRGDVTRPDSLRDGPLQVDTRVLCVLVVVLGAIYGLCMASYSLLKVVPPELNDPSGRYWQLLASAVKVPALFYLTLLVTFPSLYVFNALVGSRLTMTNMLRLLVASLAVNLAVLASLGPITLFFSISTTSYAFVRLLNVLMFTVAGTLGLMFLLQTLHRLTRLQAERGGTGASSTPPAPDDGPAENPNDGSSQPVDDASALDMPPGEALSQHTRMVFNCWVVLFAVVGAQMGWVLRPFVGSPNLSFAWFRERQSNFFEAVLRSIGQLFSGG